MREELANLLVAISQGLAYRSNELDASARAIAPDHYQERAELEARSRLMLDFSEAFDAARRFMP